MKYLRHQRLIHFTSVFLVCQSYHPIKQIRNRWHTLKGRQAVPLTLQLIMAAYLEQTGPIGKRFSTYTNYLMIDIDIDSPWHPRQQGLNKVLEVLESVGIVRCIFIQSSQSQGIHIYCPLPETVKSFNLACLIYNCFIAAGISVRSGELELFPNPKFSRETEYNGHRLPFQEPDSFQVNQFGEPVCNQIESIYRFADTWQQAAARQDFELLSRLLTTPEAQRRQHLLKAEPVVSGQKFSPVLAERIERGWTSHHQTNEILGALSAYAFQVLGLDNVEAICDFMLDWIVRAPGYKRWCRHQHEIQRRCRDWTKCTLRQWGRKQNQARPQKNSNLNRDRAQTAWEKLQQALEAAQQHEFRTKTELLQWITKTYKMSLSTLNKPDYKSLIQQVWEQIQEKCSKPVTVTGLGNYTPPTKCLGRGIEEVDLNALDQRKMREINPQMVAQSSAIAGLKKIALQILVFRLAQILSNQTEACRKVRQNDSLYSNLSPAISETAIVVSSSQNSAPSKRSQSQINNSYAQSQLLYMPHESG